MKIKTAATFALLLSTIPALQGCFPLIATGFAVSALAVTDRRTVGAQTEDEGIEWKLLNALGERFKDQTHLNVTSYNRRVLLSGEVPNESVRQAMGEQARNTENVQGVWNELQIAPSSSLAARSNDAFITSKVKARFVDANSFSPVHVKVVTEAGSVYLLGLVSEREAKLAIQLARTTDGVRKVVNLLEIRSDEEIQRIDRAYSSSTHAPK